MYHLYHRNISPTNFVRYHWQSMDTCTTEISHQLISCDIIDIAWILVPSHHITSHHITSHHITSHHIIIIIIIRPKPAKPRMGSQDHWPGYSQMDIAFICQHRHHRQWCNFSSRYPFLHREFKILANIGSFVANLHTFWCTFTELNYAVVPQNWQILTNIKSDFWVF